MGQTAHEIEDQLQKTRTHLDANLQELEQKARDAVNWRYHFQNHPVPFVGLAMGAGALLAITLAGTRARPVRGVYYDSASLRRRQSPKVWQSLKDAVIAAAAAQAADYLRSILPNLAKGFSTAGHRP